MDDLVYPNQGLKGEPSTEVQAPLAFGLVASDLPKRLILSGDVPGAFDWVRRFGLTSKRINMPTTKIISNSIIFRFVFDR